MAVAFDADSANGSPGVEFTTTAGGTWTHAPAGTARSVSVRICGRGGTPAEADITGVTYGGVALSKPAVGFAQDTVTEIGAVWQYHLGASIPTGSQTVVITVAGSPGSTAFRAHATTHTASADTQVIDSDLVQENAANPSVNLDNASSLECTALIALFSGASPGSVAPGASYTEEEEVSLGGGIRTWSWARLTSNSTSNPVQANYVYAIDDTAMIAMLITEVGGAGGQPARKRAGGVPFMAQQRGVW